MQTPLTTAALRRRAWEWRKAQSSKMRIWAYNVNGERIGVAGVGEGDQRLTFPAKLRVEQVLGFHHWIKASQPGAEKWYVVMGDWRPKAIVFEDGRLAAPDDPIGMGGSYVTIIATEVAVAAGEDREMPSLAGVRTPPTPSMSDRAASDDDSCQMVRSQ